MPRHTRPDDVHHERRKRRREAAVRAHADRAAYLADRRPTSRRV
jgi:hypothetical protein